MIAVGDGQVVLLAQTAVARMARVVIAAAIASASGCATHAAMQIESSRPKGGENVADAITYYLPKQLVAIDLDRRLTQGAGGTVEMAGYEDTLTLRLLPPVPDTERRFIAYLPGATARGEAFTAQTTEAGLLTFAGAPASDRAGEVLDRIVASGVAASVQPLKATVIVDPTVPADLARAESQLRSLGARYRFELTQVGSSRQRVITFASGMMDASLGADFRAPIQHESGLFYRRSQPYVLAVYRPGPGNVSEQQFVSAAEVSLPNEAPPERASFSTAALLSSEGALFQDGMLGARPAPLIAGVPANTWKALMPKRPHFRFKFSTSNEPGGSSEPADPPDTQTEIVKALLSVKKAEENQSKGT